MKHTISIMFLLLFFSLANGQNIDTDWFSETVNNGVKIQNSFPKGGPYLGPTKHNFNHSYLVFYTRVVNETEDPLEIAVNFSADSIAIPQSPGTFMKIFLPADTMTLEKEDLFSYGVTELESLEKSTQFQRTIDPKEDCLFYVVAIYFQTKEGEWSHERGRNRAELVLNGQDLFYSLPPQIDLMPCGTINFVE